MATSLKRKHHILASLGPIWLTLMSIVVVSGAISLPSLLYANLKIYAKNDITTRLLHY